jgi:hypothetical protein
VAPAKSDCPEGKNSDVTSRVVAPDPVWISMRTKELAVSAVGKVTEAVNKPDGEIEEPCAGEVIVGYSVISRSQPTP